MPNKPFSKHDVRADAGFVAAGSVIYGCGETIQELEADVRIWTPEDVIEFDMLTDFEGDYLDYLAASYSEPVTVYRATAQAMHAVKSKGADASVMLEDGICYCADELKQWFFMEYSTGQESIQFSYNRTVMTRESDSGIATADLTQAQVDRLDQLHASDVIEAAFVWSAASR